MRLGGPVVVEVEASPYASARPSQDSSPSPSRPSPDCPAIDWNAHLANASSMDMNQRDPDWLERMRAASVQRPRTRFRRIAWADLQKLIRERDMLWHDASTETRERIEALRNADGHSSPRDAGAMPQP